MTVKKLFLLKLVVVVAVTFLGIGKVQAGFINLTSLAAQPANSGNAIVPWLALAVSNYNLGPNPDLPAGGLEEFRNNQNQNNGPSGAGFPQFGDNVTMLSIPVGGYEYLALHWGGPGKTGNDNLTPNYQLFYIGDPAGATHFTADNSPDNQGLSWYALFNPKTGHSAPDGGVTLVLLGLSLSGLAAVRRKIAS